MISRSCNNALCKTFLVLACIAITAGCAGLEGQSKPAPVPEIRPGILAGYLKPEVLPNSLALIPPPPAKARLRSHWMKRSAEKVLHCAARRDGNLQLKTQT